MRAAAVLVALSLAGCARRPAPAPVAPAPASIPTALIAERWPDGGTYALSEDRGQVVLIDVWATWCEPCRVTLPLYQRLLAQHGARGLKVYAMSVDEDPRGIEPFLRSLNVTLPVLHDTGGLVAEHVLHVERVPSLYLFDRRGNLRHVHEGIEPALEEAVQAELTALLAEP